VTGFASLHPSYAAEVGGLSIMSALSMMARLARDGAVAVGEHRNQGGLHDRAVGGIQPRNRADVGHRRIQEGAVGCSQQPCDLRLIGDVSLELSDAKQVV
jgi:hypothetical protein